MVEFDRTDISGRLRSLPRQLLLALINATAILVIAAAVLALIAMSRMNHFVETIAATMTEAVLSKVDLPAKDVLANLRNLTAEVRTLGNSLRDIRAVENPRIQAEIAHLQEVLTALSGSVDRLATARANLTDEAIVQLSRTVADALLKLRDCSSNLGRMESRHTEIVQSHPAYRPPNQETGSETCTARSMLALSHPGQSYPLGPASFGHCGATAYRVSEFVIRNGSVR